LTVQPTGGAEVQDRPPLTLTMADDGSPVAELSWCLSQDMQRSLAGQLVHRAFLLVVVACGNKEMSRHVFPVLQRSRMVRFCAGGANQVLAKLVWLSNDRDPSYKLLDRDDDGGYRYSLLVPVIDPVEVSRLDRNVDVQYGLLAQHEFGTEEYEAANTEYQRLCQARDSYYASAPVAIGEHLGSGVLRSGFQAEIVHDVNPEHFAKRDDHWVSTLWLAGLYPFWEGNRHDPCHTRRRATVTGVTLPMAWLYGLAAAAFDLAVVIGFLFCGRRRVNARPILHPWRLTPREIWRNIGPSVYTTKVSKIPTPKNPHLTTRQPRPMLVRWLAPPLVVFIFTAVWLNLQLGFGLAPAYAVVCGFAAVVVYAAMGAGAALFIRLRKAHGEAHPKRRFRDTHARESRDSAAIMAALAQVTCDQVGRPRRRRPVQILEQVEGAVCKPYERT
jgi:hypothetical protein